MSCNQVARGLAKTHSRKELDELHQHVSGVSGRVHKTKNDVADAVVSHLVAVVSGAPSSPKKASPLTPKKSSLSTPKKSSLSTPKKSSTLTPKKSSLSTPKKSSTSTPKKSSLSTPKKTQYRKKLNKRLGQLEGGGGLGGLTSLFQTPPSYKGSSDQDQNYTKAKIGYCCYLSKTKDPNNSTVVNYRKTAESYGGTKFDDCCDDKHQLCDPNGPNCYGYTSSPPPPTQFTGQDPFFG